MLSINLPIWRKKLSSQVQSANRMIESNKSRYEDILNKTLFEVEDAYFKIDTARESYSLFKDALIPQADQSMKSAEAGYITGVSSFLDLLDAERTLLNVQFGYWKAYVDYLKRIADTERAVGRELLALHPYGSPAPTEEE
jgi:multidrug efflux system outer membrane protein